MFGFSKSTATPKQKEQYGSETTMGVSLGVEPPSSQREETTIEEDVVALFSRIASGYPDIMRELEAKFPSEYVSQIRGLQIAEEVNARKQQEMIGSLIEEYQRKGRELQGEITGYPEYQHDTERKSLMIEFCIEIFDMYGIDGTNKKTQDLIGVGLVDTLSRLLYHTFRYRFDDDEYKRLVGTAIHLKKMNHTLFLSELRDDRPNIDFESENTKQYGERYRRIQEQQRVKDEAVFQIPDETINSFLFADDAAFQRFVPMNFRCVTEKEPFDIALLSRAVQNQLENKRLSDNGTYNDQHPLYTDEDVIVPLTYKSPAAAGSTHFPDGRTGRVLQQGDVTVRDDIKDSLADPTIHPRPRITTIELGTNVHNMSLIEFMAGGQLKIATFGFGYNGSTPEIDDIERDFRQKVSEIVESVFRYFPGLSSQQKIAEIQIRVDRLIEDQIHYGKGSLYSRDPLFNPNARFKQRVINDALLHWAHIYNIEEILRSVVDIESVLQFYIPDGSPPGFVPTQVIFDNHYLQFDERVMHYESLVRSNRSSLNGAMNCSAFLNLVYRVRPDQRRPPYRYNGTVYQDREEIAQVNTAAGFGPDTSMIETIKKGLLPILQKSVGRKVEGLVEYVLQGLSLLPSIDLSLPSNVAMRQSMNPGIQQYIFNIERIIEITGRTRDIRIEVTSPLGTQQLNTGAIVSTYDALLESKNTYGIDQSPYYAFLSAAPVTHFRVLSTDAILGGPSSMPNDDSIRSPPSSGSTYSTVGSYDTLSLGSQYEIPTEEHLRGLNSGVAVPENTQVIVPGGVIELISGNIEASEQLSQSFSQGSFSQGSSQSEYSVFKHSQDPSQGSSIPTQSWGSYSQLEAAAVRQGSTVPGPSQLSRQDSVTSVRSARSRSSNDDEDEDEINKRSRVLTEEERSRVLTEEERKNEFIEAYLIDNDFNFGTYDNLKVSTYYNDALEEWYKQNQSNPVDYGGKRKTRKLRKHNKKSSNRKTKKLRKPIKPIKPIREKKTTKRHKKRLLRKSRKY